MATKGTKEMNDEIEEIVLSDPQSEKLRQLEAHLLKENLLLAKQQSTVQYERFSISSNSWKQYFSYGYIAPIVGWCALLMYLYTQKNSLFAVGQTFVKFITK